MERLATGERTSDARERLEAQGPFPSHEGGTLGAGKGAFLGHAALRETVMRGHHGRWLDRTHQRWKVRAVYLTSAIQISALVAAFIVVPENRITAFWVLAGTVIPFWLLVLSVRCRVCGEYVMLWAWKRTNTIGDLHRLEACPQCGALDDDDGLMKKK